MSEPFVGEIKMFAGNFAPRGWMFCEGQLLSISQYEVLFSLIGTTYGGDGVTTFALPDLRGRLPVQQGQGPGISQQYAMGEMAGVETVTLTLNQLPTHNHAAVASESTANGVNPAGTMVATTSTSILLAYALNAPDTTLANNTLLPAGGSQPHENLMPSLCVSFIIAIYGIFPSQN